MDTTAGQEENRMFRKGKENGEIEWTVGSDVMEEVPKPREQRTLSGEKGNNCAYSTLPTQKERGRKKRETLRISGESTGCGAVENTGHRRLGVRQRLIPAQGGHLKGGPAGNVGRREKTTAILCERAAARPMRGRPRKTEEGGASGQRSLSPS